MIHQLLEQGEFQWAHTGLAWARPLIAGGTILIGKIGAIRINNNILQKMCQTLRSQFTLHFAPDTGIPFGLDGRYDPVAKGG